MLIFNSLNLGKGEDRFLAVFIVIYLFLDIGKH